MKVRIAALHYTHFLGVVTANVFYISLTFVHSPSSALAADGLQDNSPAIRRSHKIGPTPARFAA